MGKKILQHKSKGAADVHSRLRAIDRKQRHAVLATLSGNRPYTSLVAFALTPDARSVLFATPRKTRKYRNILDSRHVSLLINTARNIPKDYANAEAVTIQGEAFAIRRGAIRNALAAILVRKHPDLKAFVNASSTALVMVKVKYCVHVSRFQAVTEWSNKRD